MNEYLLARLRANANYLLVLAENERKIPHQGLKGRFRELFVHNLLTPWLPPYIACGTGMIIDDQNLPRKHNQDDVILYDKMLASPILASEYAPEGVFLYNSVLGRVEIKSILTKAEIRTFVDASEEMSQLKFTRRLGFKENLFGAINALFAYGSDVTGQNDPDYEINRVINVMKETNIDPLSGKVSAVCIAGHGLWKINEENKVRYWARLNSDKPEDPIVWFLAIMASMCFDQHLQRLGATKEQLTESLSMGIGQSLDDRWVRANI